MAEPDGMYIYHTRKPRFLARAEGNVIEIVDDVDSMIEYYGGDVSKIEGLLNRMKDWYKAYKINQNGRDRQVHGEN